MLLTCWWLPALLPIAPACSACPSRFPGCPTSALTRALLAELPALAALLPALLPGCFILRRCCCVGACFFCGCSLARITMSCSASVAEPVWAGALSALWLISTFWSVSATLLSDALPLSLLSSSPFSASPSLLASFPLSDAFSACAFPCSASAALAAWMSPSQPSLAQASSLTSSPACSAAESQVRDPTS